MTDTILVIGATGFTGKLALKYLAYHPERASFKLQAGGRSATRVQASIIEVGTDIEAVILDTLQYDQVERAVLGADVILNCAGPFHRYSSNVVAACARNGRAYVDITGEHFWVLKLKQQLDFVAFKNSATIVPCCAYDSVPADILAYLGVQSLKKLLGPDAEAAKSVTSHKMTGGISGGTLATMLSSFDEVPFEDLKASAKPYSLSPVKGANAPGLSFVSALPQLKHPKSIHGGIFVMSLVNKAVVQQSWGIFKAFSSKKDAYGDSFTYDEFLQTPGAVSAAIMSSVIVFGFVFLSVLAPVRWLVKRSVPQAGQGPSQKTMDGGRLKMTNVTSSAGPQPRHVKTTLYGKADPGYKLASVLVSECALSLLPKNRHLLPSLGQQGGFLTPATAFGDVLVERLKASGFVEFSSEELVDGGRNKGKQLL